MAISQENRLFQVSSALASEELHFYRMTAHESLGRLFEFHVDLFSENDELDPNSLLGTYMEIEFLCGESRIKRYFGGYVARFESLGFQGSYGYTRYRVTLVPWLWFLTRSADCRIFQSQNVAEIIEFVFKDIHGFTDFRRALTGSYPTLDYCVQYRETAFNFVSRLMEEAGIYYFFEFEAGKHTLVLCDSSTAHGHISGEANFSGEAPKVPYYPLGNQEAREEDHISEWSEVLQVQPGNYALDDFDFSKPRADLSASSSLRRSHDQADGEYFDYPGGYLEASDGSTLANQRLQELQASFERARGSGNVQRLLVGAIFTLVDFPIPSKNKQYLIVSTSYEIQNNEYEPGVDKPTSSLACSFEVMDASTQFRSQRVTPKPVVQGPQTAIVVGKSGEEIWTDQYGRVKVQFHWDRLGASDENSSCWVRVAQKWAGNAWGSMQIPRMGQEVVVEFLEGDPDRPLITGSVYNAVNMPPYALPDNQTQSGLKSRSTKQGTGENFNELRFEDKKDEEHIYFHAEKDFERVVENNDTLRVGFDKMDPGDQTIDIYNHRTTTIEQGNETLTVKTGNRTTNIDTGDETLTVKTGNRVTDVDTGNDTLTVKTGDQTIKVDIGKQKIEAAQSIELIVGSSSIKIEPSAITISAATITIEGSATVDVTSPSTTCEGSGSLTLKGGVVQIN